MNRNLSATLLLVSAIILPGLVAQLSVGSQTLLSLPPRNAGLLLMGTLLCGLIGAIGARSILRDEEDEDEDE
jgi:hypothetical protein